MAEDEEELEGASLVDALTLLEALTDTARIRVPDSFFDKHGNIILPVAGVYFLDTTGGVHEPVNTSGYVPMTGGDATSRSVPTFPGGVLTSTQYQFTNDGANSGNHSVKVEPASECPMFLHWYAVYNGDAAGRVTTLKIHSAGATELATLYTATLGATTYDMWPDEGGPLGGLLVSSSQELVSLVAAVAVSKATRHVLQYTYYGATAPTVTTSGPTNCTIAAIS